MSEIQKKTTQFGSREYTWYTIPAPEVQTMKDCVALARKIAGIGKLKRVECRGYHDMDTHENYGFYNSVEEFDEDLERLGKLDIDTINITTSINGFYFGVEMNPVGDNKNGTSVCVNGTEREELGEAVKAVQKILKGWKGE